MASKPVTTDPPTIRVEEIVREFYIEMKRELNLKVTADALYAKGLIDHGLKETIDRKEMTQDANELFLDHLIRNGTLETLRRFCEVLEETAQSHSLPHHRAWSNKLKRKLTKYTTCSSDPTPQSSQDELSPTSVKLKESPSMMVTSPGLPSSSSPVTRGESTQTMSTMDERSKKIKEIVDKYREGKGDISLPENTDLEESFDRFMCKKFLTKLSSADPGRIREIQAMMQRKYRKIVHGVRPVPLPPVPNTADGLFDFIGEKSNFYEILLVHHAVEVLEDEDLKKDLQEYESKLAEYLKEMLTSCKRKRVTLPLHKDHTHMAIVISKEQVLLSLVLEMKEYFSKYLQLEETLFEGFEEGCTVLFFSILTVDAALLSPKVLSHLSELKRMFGMTHLIVFGYFACDLEKATIELVSDSEDVVSLKTEKENELAAVRSSHQTKLEKVTREKAELEREKAEFERENSISSLYQRSVEKQGMAVAHTNWQIRLEYLKEMLQKDLNTMKDGAEKVASLQALSQISEWYIANKEEEKAFTILIIGQTGSGKSTLVNNLLGDQVAEVGHGEESCTNTIQKHSSTIQGIPITLYDTPSLQDSGNTETNDVDRQILGEIKSMIEGKSIYLVIFCFKITEIRLLPQTVEDFKKYHEIGIPWNKTVVALTFADRLTREDGPLEWCVQKWKDCIRKNILVEKVGLTPHTTHQIAFRPTTQRPDIPLPGNKDWFVPLWFTVLEVLDPKAMIDFLMIHNKKLKDSQRTVDMEESPGMYALEFIKQRYEKTFKTRITKLLVKAAEKLIIAGSWRTKDL